MRIPFRSLLLAPLFLAACDGGGDAGSRNQGPPAPATDYLLVTTGDGMVLLGDVPRITIYEADGGLAQIEVRGEATDEDGTRLWYFYGRIAPNDLIDGFAEDYDVHGTTSQVPGIVNVGIETPPGGDIEVARAGKTSMQWFDGWYVGQVVNDDPRMAADFKGGYRITCAYLPDNPSAGGERIVDETFESEFCSPFAGLLPEPGEAP